MLAQEVSYLVQWRVWGDVALGGEGQAAPPERAVIGVHRPTTGQGRRAEEALVLVRQRLDLPIHNHTRRMSHYSRQASVSQ